LKRRLVLLVLAVAIAAAPRPVPIHRAAGSIAAARLPYLPGSTIPIRVNGFGPPYALFVSGAGAIQGDRYTVLAGSGANTVIASGRTGLAMRSFAIAPTPDPRRPFIAVASYDDGIILHDVTAPFRARAALGIDGAPGDIAINAAGAIATTATDGTSATIASLDPWTVHRYDDVPFGDQVAFDPTSGALFVTNRELGGAGALTRIASDGSVAHRVLGLTAEGIAIDPVRQRVYVANVNDGTVSIVDSRSMVELRRFHVIDRVFSLALSGDGSRLFAVSNQSLDSPFAAAGSVVAVDTIATDPHVVARSERLAFPIGIVFEGARDRLFVTDEDTDAVDVLDARTLRAIRAPLRTCETPWKPSIDRGLLFIPCARSDQIDVFDLATLRRVAGAPFATGGYPLAVAIWKG
jgi:DNA-binding beta-propeller fold protein YncE